MGNYTELEKIFTEMREIQLEFLEAHGVNDIWSNSKMYEILQANTLNQVLIPGHSGSLDARDADGNEIEYKHYKETSSNHSWTFNDYSDSTILKLEKHVHEVIYAHIDDTKFPPKMDWAIHVSGEKTAEYLREHTRNLKNTRRMINISSGQIASRLGIQPRKYNVSLESGPYSRELKRIFALVIKLETIVGVENILTSNKFWEVLVSLPLGHQVNSEQGGRSGDHDAHDQYGGDYEYKVSSSKSWNFQDISDAVLLKYLKCEDIVLAIVDKTDLRVEDTWMAKPDAVVLRLKQKLAEKKARYADQGKELRRLQVSLSAGDLKTIGARKIN
jgi:hypothetical protein